MKKVFSEDGAFDESHEKYWVIRVTINQCKNAIKSKDFNNFSLLDNDNVSKPFEPDIESKLA